MTEEVLETVNLAGWQSWSPTWSKLARALKFLPDRQSPFGKNGFEQVQVPEKIRDLPPVRGWSSWYAFGPRVRERDILANAQWIKDHPQYKLEYIVIDDGWTAWGDWATSDKERFPSGMKTLARTIKDDGLKSGIWIAPFLVEKESTLFQDHPDWLVRNKRGQLVDGMHALPGNLAIRKRYLLDVSKEEVRDHLFASIDTLLDEDQWGYQFIKLDFLYAIYFDP
ncbi:glycoside hydrolase family 36 protein, partial [Patescibacteria group bacterium]